MGSLASVEPGTPNSNVEWGAIFAGAVIATAIGVILIAFGAALGLGFSSPYDGEGMSIVAFAIAAGLYLLWVQVMSFYMGGYVTGRLRARAPGASEHEVDVRDGLHGLICWAVGVLAAAFIAFVGVGGLGMAARPQNQVSASVSQVVEKEVNQAAADARVSEAPADSTAAERRAEIARKWSVISAFITAASLLVGAAAAFYGAHSGGNHRDRNVKWDFFTSRVRAAPKATPRTDV